MNKHIQDKLKEFEEKFTLQTNEEVLRLLNFDRQLRPTKPPITKPRGYDVVDLHESRGVLSDFLKEALEDIYQRGVVDGGGEMGLTLPHDTPKEAYQEGYTEGVQTAMRDLDKLLRDAHQKGEEEGVRGFVERWNSWASSEYQINEDNVEAMEQYLKNGGKE